ncbi:MAG: DegV family protein [Bacilli bacterium]|nr:DegV family protein [Bacilli bacterium]
MRKIAILTDSTSDLSKALREEYNIDYCPMAVSVDGEEYSASLDYETFTPSWIYGKMREGSRVKTVQVTVEIFNKKFEEYLAQGMDIIYVACSSALSGSCNTGRIIAPELIEKYPGSRIVCIDALASTMTEGLVAVLAAQLRNEGKTIDEIVDTVEAEKKNFHMIAAVETLTYLKNAGRVSAGKAFFGNLLGMKPILISNLKGENYAIKKVRGRKASLEEMISMMQSDIIDPENQIIYITHSDCEEDAKTLGAILESKMKVKGIVYGPIGPIVGSSVGPGAISIAYKGQPVNI